ncbi:hypothetical protein [Sphingomonas sp. Leaf4]|uniref:hypothetical protein n=1 Tax=Sphingomonas sp. Leaf4 TaxID=2876553 RepID=UPI001E3464E4|nr:hypothetical protein [Sphingomonas sp. Leaf4]
MPHRIDFGAGPASEACAQLGRTNDFARLNRLELVAYRAALIACFGPPPEGCHFGIQDNHHDFGTYRTLVLSIDPVMADDQTVVAYVEQVEGGLASWIEVGLTAPVEYDARSQAVTVRDLRDVIVSALLVTRPTTDGSFPVADFSTLHGNLTAAWPDEAAAARARVADS